MATPVFENGSLVKLKSGGPVMTVDHLIQGNSVVCCWFDDMKHSSAIFNTLTIVAVSGSDWRCVDCPAHRRE